jgi:hypothetical protein
MRRIVGTIMLAGGILIAPPLWDGIAAGGLWPKIVFAGALASITTGLVLSFGTDAARKGKGSGLVRH